jgi:hypothetical protein
MDFLCRSAMMYVPNTTGCEAANFTFTSKSHNSDKMIM